MPFEIISKHMKINSEYNTNNTKLYSNKIHERQNSQIIISIYKIIISKEINLKFGWELLHFGGQRI